MRRLLLMRHAKSDQSMLGLADERRPLNKRGRASAPEMGALLARLGLTPDLALVSTAKRTRETYTLVADQIAGAVPVEYLPALYLASADAMLGIIRATPPDVGTLLVVAHEPGLGQLAGSLAKGGDKPALKRMRRKFSTAGIATLAFKTPDWLSIGPGLGTLERFDTPKSLVGMASAD